MLNKLKSPKTFKKSKRLGRGMSSGVGGHTVGRGLKGATARSGYQYPRKNFEGGQNPLARRLPRFKGDVRGTTAAFFNSDIKNLPVKLSVVEELAKKLDKSEISLDDLVNAGIVKLKFSKSVRPKVLFDKPITTKIVLKGLVASKTAKKAIEDKEGSLIQ